MKVNEAGPSVQPSELDALFRRVEERAAPGDLWVLAGSLPPGVPADFYARLIDLLQAAGARVILDTSGEALSRGCAAGPWGVKPNACEAAEVTGQAVASPAEVLVASDWFLRQGVHLVALSLGADGLVLASPREALWAKPPAVRARNSVGAGDALLAGLIFALLRELPLAEVARWGVSSGTAAAMRESVGAGSYDEVSTLRERVQIEVLRN